MDEFLDINNTLKLNQEEVNNLNRPITSSEVQVVIKNLPIKPDPGQVDPMQNSIRLPKKN